MNTEKREHAFEPVFSETSTRLVLGTMPSPQSVKHGFYYSHPQNRFWPLMAELFNAPKPLTPEEKTQFVLQRDIALWDVLAVCDIAGASDASIRNPVPNDIPWMLRRTRITRIYATGKTAFNLYEKLVFPTTCLSDDGHPCRLPPFHQPRQPGPFPMAETGGDMAAVIYLEFLAF